LTAASELFIDPARGVTLDRLQDFVQVKNSESLNVGQRRENQVSVVWHDYCNAQVVFCIVPMDATFRDSLPCPFRQLATIFCNKGPEVRFVIALIVRKVPALEAHGIIVVEKGTAWKA
jgi:hypothetical protein